MKFLVFVLFLFGMALGLAFVSIRASHASTLSDRKELLSKEYKMECFTVGGPYYIRRCENKETICYFTGKGLSCTNKTPVNDHVLWIVPDKKKGEE